MSYGTKLRTVVTKFIKSENFRTTVTLKTYSRTLTDGGYRPNADTLTSTTASYCIPYRLAKERLSFLKLGDLKEGEINFVFPHDSTLIVDDDHYMTITADSVVYKVKEVTNILFNEVTLVKIVRCFEEVE